jgi:hypothetical protein
MFENIKRAFDYALSLPGKLTRAALGQLLALAGSVIHSTPFLLLTLFGGIALGFLVGARVFETGNGASLKGASARVSGPCRIDGEVRKPALAEDEVKIVSISGDKMIGVIRATREAVECDMSTTAIDALPLLRDLSRSPAEIPLIKPFEAVRADQELADLKKRSLRVSGTCQDSAGQDMPPLIDQAVEVISAARQESDKAVIEIQGILKKSKSSVTCLTKNIRYSIIDGSGELAPGQPQMAQAKRDLVNEVILITSTCFPDKRLPATKKSKVLFYPLINAKLQVTQTAFDEEGKLSYVSGAIIENGAMVECDNAKYPITWRLYDPSSMKLEAIKEQAGSDEKMAAEAPAGQPAPAQAK